MAVEAEDLVVEAEVGLVVVEAEAGEEEVAEAEEAEDFSAVDQMMNVSALRFKYL